MPQGMLLGTASPIRPLNKSTHTNPPSNAAAVPACPDADRKLLYLGFDQTDAPCVIARGRQAKVGDASLDRKPSSGARRL